MLLENSLILALCIAAAAAVAVLPVALFLCGGAAGRSGRGWRLRRVADGRWSYEEKRGGAWVGIPFEENPDAEGPPYVVVAPSEDTWRTFPGWAAQRRMEIIGRVQSGLGGRSYIVSVRGPSTRGP